jgi:DNA primase large subunit
VPFEQVPDLVATRRVLLRRGWAYVSRHEVASLVVGHFRAGLSHSLAVTARRWAATIADEEADRLTPIVLSLSERCNPPSPFRCLPGSPELAYRP